jgi:hypothetical protein
VSDPLVNGAQQDGIAGTVQIVDAEEVLNQIWLELG